MAAWSDAIPREPVALGIAFLFTASISLLAAFARRYRARLGKSSPTVPLDPADRRSQIGLLGLSLLIGVALLNPSHKRVWVSSESIPKELRKLENSNEEALETRKFVPVYQPREGAFSFLPSTVNPERTTVWALKLLIAFVIAAAVASWTRHRPKIIRFACWAIFLHTIILSWVALNFRVNGTELILGRFEGTNPRFFGPFRYHNFWSAWLLLSLGAGAALFSHYLSRRSTSGIMIILVGFVSLLPPIFGAQSRSAILFSALFLGISGVRLIFHLPPFKNFSKPKLFGIAFGSGLALILLAFFAIVSTWDRWATEENAKSQEAGRMHDTIRQFAEMRDGKMPFLRPALIRDGLKVGLSKPVFGWGLGSFEYAHPLVAGPEFMDDANQFETRFYGKMLRARHVHNDFVQLWAEMGTAGFTILVIMIGTFWGKHTRSTKSSAMEGGLLTGCACVATLALWDFPLNDFAVQCLFAVCFGLAIASRTPSRSLRPEDHLAVQE